MDDSPESSILTKYHVHGQRQKDFTKGDRCTFFTDHPHRTTADWCDIGQVTIDILPDDILLYIFNVYVNGTYKTEPWRGLVHVCRRWRSLAFGSSRHLNLQLLCRDRIQVKKKLGIWPALLISVEEYGRILSIDNIIAAIKHNDRVCKIDLCTFFDVWQLEEIVSVMQVPFPALTDLTLVSTNRYETMPVIPDSFLGGSAPRLQHFHLDGISFPGSLTLLLSASNLVDLELWRLPHSWDIPPDAMITHLSALIRLKLFTLGFEYPQFLPVRESRHSPPLTRTLLSALTRLTFEGVSEYAEYLVTWIEAPSLAQLHITVFNEPIPSIPHLLQFISRVPKFQALDKAHVHFSDYDVKVELQSATRTSAGEGPVLGISRGESVGRLSSLTRLCRSSLPALAMVEHLYIHRNQRRRGVTQHNHWLELLYLFTGAKNLYLSRNLTSRIAPILQELVGARTTLDILLLFVLG